MTDLERQYLRELRWSMTIACLVFAFPIWAGLVSGNWLFAAGGYLAAEIHFWLCSTKPTDQWLAERERRQ